MPIIKGLEWTFDTVSSTYAKMRPGYVEELYRKIFDYSSIDETSNVIEVGIGGGQATEPILKMWIFRIISMTWYILHQHFIGFLRKSAILKSSQC